MKSTTRLAWTSVAAVLCAATPALAAAPVGLAGIFSAAYAHIENDNRAPFRVNTWDIGGQLAMGFMRDFAAELDGGYTEINPAGPGLKVEKWNVGGHAFWAPAMGRAGVSVYHQNFSGGGTNLDYTSIGGFGEFYASDAITLGVNGGGILATCPFACSDGGYANAGGMFYPTPNFSILATVGFSEVVGMNYTLASVGGEWKFSQNFPISTFAKYTLATGPGGISNDQYLVGLRFYTDGNGDTLVEKHRNSALSDLVRTGLNLLF